MEDEQIQVQYLSYDQLQDQFHNLPVISKWQDEFLWIDNQRIMNKFHQAQFQIEWPQLQSYCDSLRSNVAKNAILLLKELVLHDIYNEEIIAKIFEKCSSDYKFLKEEAFKGVTVIESKAYTPLLIQILAQVTLTTRFQLYSYPALVKIISKTDFTHIDFKPVIAATIEVFDGKIIECRKYSDQLYQKLIQYRPDVLQWQEAQPLRFIADRLKSKKPQPNFREFLKQKQQQ